MAERLYKGFYEALQAGLLEGTPDIRCHLVMSGFTADADAVHMDDVTLDEFDGVNYVALDCANVTAGYVDGSDEWRLDFDDDTFGADVAPGSGVVQGMVVRLHIDGTDANDYVLGYTDRGGFGVNAANGDLDLTLPASGLLFVRQA